LSSLHPFFIVPLSSFFTLFLFATSAFAQSAAYQVGVIPPESKPVIPPGDDIIIYVHGGPGSRLEEAADIVNPLLAASIAKGERYTIVAFDQPSQGYSSMHDPAEPTWCLITDQPCAPMFPDHDQMGDYYPLVATSEEVIVAFVNALDRIAPIKNRNIYIIGGSTGGALTLRMGHRSEPWIKKIVS
jgi:pimeloyl-ACP methyl ester carboxylesterase